MYWKILLENLYTHYLFTIEIYWRRETGCPYNYAILRTSICEVFTLEHSFHSCQRFLKYFFCNAYAI